MTRPLVLCAPDKLRGALSAAGAAAALARGARAAGAEAFEHPLADGGEGTRDALLTARGGRLVEVPTVDPLGRPRLAHVALLDDGTAVVEAADAIGLALLERGERDPLAASSFGLAAPLLAALDARPRRLVVALGGTATVDGGLGVLRGLGARVVDGRGRELDGRGRDLEHVDRIDLDGLDGRLAALAPTLALDVTSPLSGPQGAAVVFAPQKGADPATVERLDAGLRRLAPLLGPAADLAGAGAAGGLGAALAAAGGRPASGAELVLAATAFPRRLAAAALCLTAEGAVDASSTSGKTVGRVVAACARAAVPCVVAGGRVDAGAADALRRAGARDVVALGPSGRPLREALAAAAGDLERVAYEAVAGLRAVAPGAPAGGI